MSTEWDGKPIQNTGEVSSIELFITHGNQRLHWFHLVINKMSLVFEEEEDVLYSSV